ncbi:hypothetical protein GCM10022406_15460 [Hymenobacter algoricola]|uniref:Secretion system C-terminal sorting domain-containing protein n=1 Tax=Hymenobacter algoricola TaxID=486267 RepID=A0ABP7MVN8_9BACT
MRAQAAPAWRWAQGFRTNQYNGPAALAVDSVGNTYLAGSFDTLLPLGAGQTLTPQDGTDGFLAKFSPTGTLLWARQLSGAGGQALSCLKLLSGPGGDRLYVAGTLAAGAVTIGPQTLPVLTRDQCAFTACFDGQGQLQWLRPLTSLSGSTTPYDTELDAAGNYYLLGGVRGAVALGAHLLTTSGPAPREEQQIFWAKFSPGGVALWARQSPIGPQSNHEVPATSLTVSASGNAVYLLGGIGQLAGVFAGMPLPPPLGGTDVLVTKCDRLGRPRWVNRSGGVGGWNNPGAAALDATGHLTVGLIFSGAAAFGSYFFSTPPGTYRAAIQVLDSVGTVVWAHAPAAQGISDLLTDPAGNLYALLYGSNGFLGVAVTCYSPSRQVRWSLTSGTGNEYPARGALGAGGHLSIVGRYQVAAAFGPFRLSPHYVRGVGPESFYLAQAGAALPLATRSSSATKRLALYPNPATDVLHLPALPAGAPVQLLDTRGRVARETTVSVGTQTIAVQGLAPGLYMLRATDARGRQYAGKLVVE